MDPVGWEGREGGLLQGSISPGPLCYQQPGVNNSLLLQAVPGPAHPSASPARCSTHRTTATLTGSVHGTRSAAQPSVEGDASQGYLPSPTVGSREPPLLCPPPWVAEGGYSDSGSGQGAVSSCQSLPLSGWWGDWWPNVWAGVTEHQT